MSKNKSSKKKTAAEKKFSEAVEKKSKQIQQTEEKSKEFSKTVEKKSQELKQAEEKREKFKRAVEEKSRENKQANKPKSEQTKSDKNPPKQSGDIVKASLCRASVIKYVIIIAVVGGISAAGLVMCVLNIIRHNWFFAADYLVASLLGLSIVIVKINTLFPTFVACDDKKVIMRAYDNRIVPYNISHKVSFLCDFIPAKTVVRSIDINKSDSIIIGTKNYIKRHCGDNKVFIDEIEKIEKSNIGKGALLGTDIICFAAGDKCEFMSVDRFDIEDLASVVRKCMKINPNIEIMCNNKSLRSKILFDLPSK